ncbi:MAG: oligoribonuclease [Verrucomicrobia bacterium]|nr:oligoribonuclease [Verrucomicrobiota bacterium]MDA1087256.1 oligoribonuclease [Verrucomicrobiota bacterium]
MARSRDYLVWIDCEMTGLDPDRDVLLEIATIVTDGDLEIIETGPVIAIYQSQKALSVMNGWCKRQHAKSGLTDRVKASRVSVDQAQRATLKFLRKHCYIRTAPLCGNSIGHDKRFLARYMPQLFDFFHYQVIDVSTVKQLSTRWYGDKYKAPEKKEAHLALDDITESIEELRHYRAKIFTKK